MRAVPKSSGTPSAFGSPADLQLALEEVPVPPIVGSTRLPLAFRRVALLILALGCVPSAVRAQTPGYPTATIYPRSVTDRAKDFCIIKAQGLWHAFYIHTGTLGENDFEHQASPDLWNWTLRSNVLTPPRSPAAWQLDHVWAPHILEKNGLYYMFYTGVRDTTIAGHGVVNQQHIGLAISDDPNLDHWSQVPLLPSGVVGYILGPESPGMSWIYPPPHLRAHFRDAFVMKDPTDDSRWLAYFTAMPQYTPGITPVLNSGAFEVGVAATNDRPGLPFGWVALNNFGSTFRVFSSTEFAPDNVSDKVESPHVLRHGSDYYLFISGDTNAREGIPINTWRGGILVLKNSNPVTDAWEYQGTLRGILDVNYAASWFASEAFSEEYSPGLDEDFFCHIDGNRAIEIRQIVWGPGGIEALVQPLQATSLTLDATRVFERSPVTLTINNEWAGEPDDEKRIAPLDVEEVDADGTNETLAPEQIGLPATLVVTGGQLNHTWNVQRVPDDDATPEIMEIRIGVRGKQTALLQVRAIPPNHDPYREWPTPHPIDPGDGRAEPAVPGTSAEIGEVLTLRVLGDTPLGPGIGLLVDAPAATQARLDLYDLQGRRIRNLIERDLQQGLTIEVWDGRDSNGARVRPGVYLARLVTPGAARTVKVLVQP